MLRAMPFRLGQKERRRGTIWYRNRELEEKHHVGTREKKMLKYGRKWGWSTIVGDERNGREDLMRYGVKKSKRKEALSHVVSSKAWLENTLSAFNLELPETNKLVFNHTSFYLLFSLSIQNSGSATSSQVSISIHSLVWAFSKRFPQLHLCMFWVLWTQVGENNMRTCSVHDQIP